MKNFKRNNWTNEEVMELLKGIGENLPIEYGIDLFYDFTRPETESGAFAYEVDEKMVYHIGPFLEP